MKSVLTFFLILAALLSGCSKNSAEGEKSTQATETKKELSKEISGGIFIVTQGGENFKLGRVSIYAVDEAKWNEHVASVLKNRGDQLDKLIIKKKEILDQCGSCLRQLKAMTDDFLPQLKSFAALNKEINENENYICSTSGGPSIFTTENDPIILTIKRKYGFDGAEFRRTTGDLVKKLESLKSLKEKISNEIKTLKDAYNKLDNEFIAANSDCFPVYFDCGDAVFDTAPFDNELSKTDADGLFEATRPKNGKYVICARATRSVGDKTERYYWAVPTTINSTDGDLNITLSNDNTLGNLSPLNKETDISGPDLDIIPETEKSLNQFFNSLPDHIEISDD